tara:strand:+ start:270 stop:542 length:273 start_codon:yes stop_codon:yes gene_type:complete
MSDEFHLDIDKALENAKQTDLNGFTKDEYPDGLESVRAAVENAEMLCGLDKNTMQALIKGEWSQYCTSNSVGRQSKKIVIEYDITYPKKD